MRVLADRALYDWQTRLQRVPVVVALAPAHREVTALDNVPSEKYTRHTVASSWSL